MITVARTAAIEAENMTANTVVAKAEHIAVIQPSFPILLNPGLHALALYKADLASTSSTATTNQPTIRAASVPGSRASAMRLISLTTLGLSEYYCISL